MKSYWLVEVPWDGCNMSGVDWFLWYGEKQQAALALPSYSREQEGNFPSWNDNVRLYEVSIESGILHNKQIMPTPDKEILEVELLQETIDKPYCSLTWDNHSGNNHLYYGSWVETPEILHERSVNLKILNKYKWDNKNPYARS